VRDLQQHPLSAAFPAMSEDELAALAADIKANGQKEAVIVFGGMVLDGWHRYLACARAGIKCVTVKHDGSDPVAFVLSRNLHRRHLTASQRAAAVVAATEWRGPGRLGKGEPGSPLSTNAEMAKAAEVDERTIQHAKAAHKAGLGDDVRDGKVSAKKAAQQATSGSTKPSAPAQSAKTKAPASDDQQLRARIAALEEKLTLAGEEIERLSAVEQGEEAALIQQLQLELRTTKAKRDDVMRENAELRRQVKFLEREAKRVAA
jgi:ParB-like chromosome segregation protein Spo0J